MSLVGNGPSGEPGGNSAYRLASVWDRFSPGEIELPTGPILLVDDLVDSRWTMTVAARALRMAGASAVLPFALALRG
jgi:ATP-dependent DNA helicase RecQ